MALKQNTSLLGQLPLRLRGGAPGTFRALWARGDLRNQSLGFGRLAGVPDGTTHPVSWLMPLQAGRISGRTGDITFTAEASGTLGLPASGSTAITFTVPSADLQLVVSAIGSASVTFSTSAGLAGALAAVGSSSISFTVPNATLGAIVNAEGNAPITWSLSASPSAIGHLSGDITPFTELSPQSLSAAVWSALASAYNDTGTMGNKLNNAASGGVDYSALADAVWNKTLP